MFWHQQDHIEIGAALQSQKNIPTVSRVLYPFNLEELNAWLERHQQTHNDINMALAINSGIDLTGVNFKDPLSVQQWVFQNAEEHAAMRAALAI